MMTGLQKAAKFIFSTAILISSSFFMFAEEQDNTTISSTSMIDWSKNQFISNINLETEKAGIKMPSGKRSAIHIIDTKLPVLLKDPLLSLYVNSTQTLGDLVLDEDVTLEKITQIIDAGKKTPGVFVNETSTLRTTHTLNLINISSTMVKHNTPYKNPKPIEKISSRAYSGIIIDARGLLPVHGEFISDRTYPCFFPEIWDEDMNLIYEKNMGNPDLQKQQGLIHYDWSDDESKYSNRVGLDPMHIRARKVYGELRTDPVISRKDALKILTVPENLQLLKDGKIVVLLDKENLVHAVDAPEKTDSYYTAFKHLKETLETNTEKGPKVAEGGPGIQLVYDFKFVADSPKLLASELPEIEKLARELIKIDANHKYTILVEGHTADVNKPDGQMKLSVERTQTIINELVKNGLNKEIFSSKGYGGTEPIATNETAEGRAKNRRVVITVRPKTRTFIQKKK